jgi:Bifunctional DNA primase/polymerase, N-terminal/Primase C terminal 1 (PriCT-1)
LNIPDTHQHPLLEDAEKLAPGARDAFQRALDAGSRGMCVFPLSFKAPAIAGGRGYKDATTNPYGIAELFQRARHRSTGYGIACGRVSGIVVVDVDSEEGLAEARDLGIASSYVVKSGKPHGRHLYYRVEDGPAIKGGNFGEHLRLQACGQYVCAPGSLHDSGRRYELVKDGEIPPAPPWLLKVCENDPPPQGSGPKVRGRGPTSIDLAGPTIPEGERDDALASAAGRLHDGSRSLEELAADLDEINQSRCTPPVPWKDILRISRSIHRRQPCRPPVDDEVEARIRYLRTVAETRGVRGRGGGSNWSVYHAGLEACGRWGKPHEDGILLRIDARTWGAMAAKSASTVSRFVRRSPMVRRLSKGTGRKPMLVLFVVPKKGGAKGHSLQQSNHYGVSGIDGVSCSVADNPLPGGALHRLLYRSRWGRPGRRSRRGLVKGTRKVRQVRRAAYEEAVKRMGPTTAALFWKILRSGEVKREALAEMQGVKPASLRAPLRMLLELGLIVRVRRGIYKAAPDPETRVEDARELTGEPLDDRLQVIRHNTERAADRYRREGASHYGPTDDGKENVRGSREAREAGMRAQEEERRRKEREPRTSEEEEEIQRRIALLVRHGMRPDFAEIEVRKLPFHI